VARPRLEHPGAPERQPAPRLPARDPAFEGATRDASGTEGACDEPKGSAIEDGTVVLAEQQEEPGEGGAPHSRETGEAPGQALSRQSLDDVEIQPRGVRLAREGGHPGRAASEAGPTGESPHVQAREDARARERAQLWPDRTATTERCDGGGRVEPAGVRRAGGS